MTRIISGNLKGKRVLAPKNFEVRPTTDFAKEALFSIINHQFHISEISVLNLFAGIGSIDYEFASRGCTDITSVELNSRHIKFIQDTSKTLDIDSSINLIRGDAFKFTEKQSKKQYDIVFADPPFELEDKNYHSLISNILENNFLAEESVFILEHHLRIKFEDHPNFIESRKYGNIYFSFFELITND